MPRSQRPPLHLPVAATLAAGCMSFAADKTPEFAGSGSTGPYGASGSTLDSSIGSDSGSGASSSTSATTTTSSTTASSATLATSASMTVDTSDATSSAGEDTGADTCGDGVTEREEECDDGNDDNTDDCLDDCTAWACGDGVVHKVHEACDDGDLENDDGCDENCELETRQVFVTSVAFFGNLAPLSESYKPPLGPISLALADAHCQKLAAAGKASADTGGTFKAWLSTPAESAADRLGLEAFSGAFFVRAFVPDVNDFTDKQVASDWSALTSGSLGAAIARDENGNPVAAGTLAWTATLANGSASRDADAECGDWMNATPVASGVTGSAWAVTEGWTDFEARACSTARRLYCVQTESD